MFSLIIGVIAIILVIIIVAATLYFGGGDLFSEGKKEASIAKALNEIRQFQSASYSYKISHGESPPNGISDLLDKKYLRSVPEGWTNYKATNHIASRLIDEKEEQAVAICEGINKKFNIEVTPQCSAIPEGFTGCCVE